MPPTLLALANEVIEWLGYALLWHEAAAAIEQRMSALPALQTSTCSATATAVIHLDARYLTVLSARPGTEFDPKPP